MNVPDLYIGPQAEDPWPSWLVKRGWSIINLDKREYVLSAISRSESNIYVWPAVILHSLESWGFLFSDVLWPLIEPVVLPMSEISPQNKRKPAGTRLRTPEESSARGMHTLPLDVQLLIFEALDNLRDVTALCLTNSDLMLAGLRRVEKLSPVKWSTWLGDRILALPGRDDHDFWDRPLPHCLEDNWELFAEIRSEGGFAAYLETYKPFKRVRCPPSLLELRYDNSKFDWQRFGGISLCHYPLDTRWVICNLSRRQYVRMPAVGSEDDFKLQMPRERRLSMWASRSKITCAVGRSVPERISCSSAKTGAWVADRLAICTFDIARAVHEDWDRWEDVTGPQDPFNHP